MYVYISTLWCRVTLGVCSLTRCALVFTYYSRTPTRDFFFLSQISRVPFKRPWWNIIIGTFRPNRFFSFGAAFMCFFFFYYLIHTHTLYSTDIPKKSRRALYNTDFGVLQGIRHARAQRLLDRIKWDGARRRCKWSFLSILSENSENCLYFFAATDYYYSFCQPSVTHILWRFIIIRTYTHTSPCIRMLLPGTCIVASIT